MNDAEEVVKREQYNHEKELCGQRLLCRGRPPSR
jgi:hypothetical protein